LIVILRRNVNTPAIVEAFVENILF
jgi:hypothetical protein